tara:strand:+ start:68 stop:430 length:363 start_codon:yes stop_codon:yes gene_type:complete
MATKKNKKKKGYTVGIGGDLYDDEYVTSPKIKADLTKENSDDSTSQIYASIEKPISKFDEENINSDLRLGYTKEGEDSSFNVEGSKRGKEKNIGFSFKKSFSTGGLLIQGKPKLAKKGWK